jgi:hypothetical protein
MSLPYNYHELGIQKSKTFELSIHYPTCLELLIFIEAGHFLSRKVKGALH